MEKKHNVVYLRGAQGVEALVQTLSPDDVGCLFEDFSPLAIIAAIPPDNVDAFLREVYDHVYCTFKGGLEIDSFRRQRKLAINNLVTATGRMIRAIECVQRCLPADPEAMSQADAWFLIQLCMHEVEKDERLGHDHQDPEPLDSLKRELTALLGRVQFLSAEGLPKRGRTRTNVLLQNIWLTAKKFGGRLTYDKRSESGTLVEVKEFLHKVPGLAHLLTDLSPSTLDRLRPR
jgi:hypothetical protein